MTLLVSIEISKFPIQLLIDEDRRGHVSLPFFIGEQWYVYAPPPHTLLTPHFHFPLELYVYITLTNNYVGFFIYKLIILWTISIN